MEYTEADISRLANKLGYKAVSDLYQSIAQGREDILQLREMFSSLEESATTHHVEPKAEYVPKEQLAGLAIEVDMNVKNVDYNLSRCCNPQPGDPIFGFISVTKGIRIHRCDCPNADNIRERYPYRMIPARWSQKSVAVPTPKRPTTKAQAPKK